ncbi:MAG: flagellar basal body rod protein FlgB [Hyphomicrobiales bacterium]|nr:flagellar basal body rod protein FlgB [Hyphomicrobiales bacterium]
MQTPALFQLAARQADWLALRQKTIAENVAQADTPGYGARDVAPFATALGSAGLAMTRTSSGHIAMSGEQTAKSPGLRESGSWDVSYSGNSVSLEQQMLKANEVRQSYMMNTNIVKAFNRMLLASLKG